MIVLADGTAQFLRYSILANRVCQAASGDEKASMEEIAFFLTSKINFKRHNSRTA